MIDVEVTTFKHGELFRLAPKIMKEERKSQVFWMKMDDAERAVLCLRVREALMNLAENPDIWLPDSLEPTGSDWIRIRFQLDPVNPRTYEEDLQLHRERREAAGALLELEQDLR